MGVRTAAAAHLSIGARLRVSRLLRGELGWQRAASSAALSLRGPRVPDGYRLGGTLRAPVLGRVVDRFDSWAVRRETAEAMVDALRGAEVPFAVLGEAPVRVVVPLEHAAALRRVLAALARPEWTVVRSSGASVPLVRWLRRGGPDRAVSVFRALVAADGTALGSASEAVEIELWSSVADDETPCADGGLHVRGTLLPPRYNGTAAYLTPSTWAAAQRRVDRRLVTHAGLTEVDEPIDVVYTWVDGTDPAWQAARARAQAELPDGAVNPNAVSSSRFLGHDELRYSMRSIEMFASWVRRVHVVTSGQMPEWLDVSHPQVSVVDHREIFSDTTSLPVFNSHAIESQLHHIPGLADRYLYLNDDVFFGRPVAPELFFEGNGLSRFFLSRALLELGPASVRDLPVMSAAKHNRELIENLTSRTLTRKVKHTPHPQQRRVLEELEERYPEVFKQLVGSRFRDPEDHSVASALHHWYAYVTGRAVEGAIAYDYLDLASDQAVLTLNRISRARDFDVFCLNDTNLDDEQRGDRSRMIQEMLRTYFPVRSAFELEGR
ncbi:stealth family protein [Luteimicrobium sp. DT211]|uniref:stealth family protein n=1 Tax=Luteimicrobium sp. DT211 TaxID=3393412 RepID=UPI003CF80617